MMANLDQCLMLNSRRFRISERTCCEIQLNNIYITGMEIASPSLLSIATFLHIALRYILFAFAEIE
jgi:hypothetical protein